MGTPSKDFNSRLKAALLGTSDRQLVFLGNFDVENAWAEGEAGLPRVGFAASNALVNRMDEFSLLLAGDGDCVVLKAAPDPGYLDYLRGLGIRLPRVLPVRSGDPQATVTQDALADPAVRDALRALAGTAQLAPHGVSRVEERLAEETGVPLAAPSEAVCKAVNSKIYSRRLADEAGLRQARGWTADTLAEFDVAVSGARALLDRGVDVVVKDAFGVSGKGITVVRDTRRLYQLHRMVTRRAERSGSDRVSLLIEEWVAKERDLNYQFTLGRDGTAHFDFVKEALTEGGVHQGHRFPAALTGEQTEQIERTCATLGKRLAADGFHGVVGVDAMLDPEGGLYPMVEINARNNMSTYQCRLQETFVPEGHFALARHYGLRLPDRLPFDRLHGALRGALLSTPGEAGLVINNFATVNASAPEDGTGTFEGRLYGLIVARSTEEIAVIDKEITGRLAVLQEENHRA